MIIKSTYKQKLNCQKKLTSVNWTVRDCQFYMVKHLLKITDMKNFGLAYRMI